MPAGVLPASSAGTTSSSAGVSVVPFSMVGASGGDASLSSESGCTATGDPSWAYAGRIAAGDGSESRMSDRARQRPERRRNTGSSLHASGCGIPERGSAAGRSRQLDWRGRIRRYRCRLVRCQRRLPASSTFVKWVASNSPEFRRRRWFSYPLRAPAVRPRMNCLVRST